MPKELIRFRTTILKPASPNSYQTPVVGATVTVCYRGASVSAAVSFAGLETKTVNVYTIGGIKQGDTLVKGTSSSPTFSVIAVLSNGSLSLKNNSGNTASLATNDRLRITNRTPIVYNAPTGSSIFAITPTTDSNGLLEFYCHEHVFDYMVSAPGVATTLYLEAQGGDDRMWDDASEFDNIQTAIDYSALMGRSWVKIPAGTYYPTSSPAFTGVSLPQNFRLQGAGPNLTILWFNSSSYNNTHMIDCQPLPGGALHGNVEIRDIHLKGCNVAGTGNGVNFYSNAADTQFSNLLIYNLYTELLSGWGMKYGADGGGYSFIDQSYFYNVKFGYGASGCQGSVFLSGGASNITHFHRCEFNMSSTGTYGPDNVALRGSVHVLHDTDVSFNECSFQMVDGGPALSLENIGRCVRVDNSHFETNNNLGTRNGHWITCDATTGHSNLLVTNCLFARYTADKSLGLRILKVECPIEAWAFKDCYFFCNKEAFGATDDVVLDSVTTFRSDLVFDNCLFSVNIGPFEYDLPSIQNQTNGASIKERVTWRLPSRFRFPVFPTTAGITALASPYEGEVVYDKQTHQLKVYNGTSWTAM